MAERFISFADRAKRSPRVAFMEKDCEREGSEEKDGMGERGKKRRKGEKRKRGTYTIASRWRGQTPPKSRKLTVSAV